MKENLINSIEKTGKFSDELFLEIIETTDVLERAELIENARTNARKSDVLENLIICLRHGLQKVCK